MMTGRRRGLCGADLRSGHGHFQTGLVKIADEGGFEAALHVVQQLEAVSHIAQGDAVALAALTGRHGVGDLDHGDLAAKARGNAQLRAAGAKLHAVLDDVFPIAFNALLQIDVFIDNDYTYEEMKRIRRCWFH